MKTLYKIKKTSPIENFVPRATKYFFGTSRLDSSSFVSKCENQGEKKTYMEQGWKRRGGPLYSTNTQ